MKKILFRKKPNLIKKNSYSKRKKKLPWPMSARFDT